MATNSTTYEIEIAADASSADAAASAVNSLASQLSRAKDAASSAASAVSSAEASYRASEATADGLAKALEKVGVAADAQRQKMAAAMQAGNEKAFWRAAGAAEKLAERQRDLAAKASAANAALQGEATALDRLRGQANAAADAEKNLTKRLGDMKGKASSALKLEAAQKGTGNLGKLSGALGQLGGPLGKAGGAVTGFGNTIGDLTETLGAGGPYVALAVLAVAFAAAGVAAAAALGKATFWAVKLADKEGAIDKMRKRLETGFKGLFSGLKIDKLLTEMNAVVDLFDETNASGRAIKVVFESLFQPIVDGAAAMIPKIRTAFLDFQILALKALIAIKPYGGIIMGIVKAFVVFSAVVVGVLAVGIGLAVAALVAMVAITAAVAHGFVTAALAIGDFVKNGIDFLSKLDLTEIGKNMIMGLVTGITGSGGAVTEAITGVASGAIDAAKKALGIASPSKVFAQIGGHTAEGMAQGVDDGAGQVQSSMASMIEPPDAGASGGGEKAGGGGGLNFAGAQFIFQGVANAEQAESRFGALLTRLIEGDVAMLGGEAPST